MKQTINEFDFVRAFETMGRKDNFSHSGLIALFEYLEEFEDSIGEEIELDVIALCCEYSEYEDIEEFWKDYDKEDYPDLDAISDETTLIMIDDKSFIVGEL